MSRGRLRYNTGSAQRGGGGRSYSSPKTPQRLLQRYTERIVAALAPLQAWPLPGLVPGLSQEEIHGLLNGAGFALTIWDVTRLVNELRESAVLRGVWDGECWRNVLAAGQEPTAKGAA